MLPDAILNPGCQGFNERVINSLPQYIHRYKHRACCEIEDMELGIPPTLISNRYSTETTLSELA